MTSPELTGGAGFTYEDAVAAHYLAALLAGTTATGLDGRVVQRVAQQQADFGEPLDDVIVDADGNDGARMRLSLQVKRSLRISDAATNDDFREVIQRSWQTLQKADFRETVDRVGAVTGTVAEDTSRSFTTVCEWARASDTTALFMARFATDGNASASHRAVADAVRAVARDSTAGPLTDDELHRLFQHLILIRFDFLHEGSTHEAAAISDLQRTLVSAQAGRAGDLWDLLRQFARDGAGRSTAHTRASLLRALRGWTLNGLPALATDMQILRDSTRHWLVQQANDIGGTHLDRQVVMDKLREQLASHRLTLIKGLPGTGKTVLLRQFVEGLATDRTTLLLTANRLAGRSWLEHARATGMSATSIEPLLAEVEATGQPTLLIDGLDRIAPEQRGVVTDLLGQLVANPDFAHWRVLATARDAGIEPLRNWVPAALLAGDGVGYVDVGNLSDDEASTLAGKLPALKPLLTDGNERVRALARRPFFAAVLARGFSRAAYAQGFAPQSEVDLIDAWWRRGGYDAQAPQTLARQRALIELAQRSAPDLGRNLRIKDLSSATQAVLPALEEDGLVQQVRAGHTVQFTHDIFFEWAFLHLLNDQAEEWIAALTAAGEPPALARVVELLSQSTYAEQVQWTRELRALMHAQVRPQWLRAWLVAPVFAQNFAEHADEFAAVLAENDHLLLGKLLVWLQAEKTTPNPLVLSGHIGGEDLQPAARIRLADSLGWPSDFQAWRRVLLWALQRVDEFPDAILPDLVTLMETWQVAAADVPNPVSERIVTRCSEWLQTVDDDEPRVLDDQASGGRHPTRRAPEGLQSQLRALVLRSARAYPQRVGSYLARIAEMARGSDAACREVMAYAPLLSQTHPALLAQIARQWVLQELPDDRMARWRREEEEDQRQREALAAAPPESLSPVDQAYLESPGSFGSEFSRHDFDDLCIGASHQGFFPASPIREPFHSLLTHAAPTGLALIRDIVNHAASAWRQLQQYRGGDGTPVPLALDFPWGRQEFWGSDQHYAWFRGHGGPQVVECALMALERWALAQQDAGVPLGDLLKQLVEGQSSISVLGIAVHLAMRAQQASATTLPLVSSLRLWRLDMARLVHEREYAQASLIGFDAGTDTPHRQAVSAINRLASRSRELRDLAVFFVLSPDVDLRDAGCAAIQAFPSRLEFAFDEEANDPDHVAALRRTAELWAEFGRPANYSTAEVPGREDVVQVTMTSARHEAEEVQQARKHHAHVAREAELWLWVDNCFSSRTWAPGFTPDEAVARASELAAAQAAGQALSFMPGSGILDGAVCGTAAAILCFSGENAHQPWADEVIERYLAAPEAPVDEMLSGSVIPWHPKNFVAQGLAARIRRGRSLAGEFDSLYSLVAHPLEAVSLTALSGVVSCWAADARYVWCGVNLGFRLAQLPRRRDVYRLTPEARRQAEEARCAAALSAALDEYRSPGPLPAWVRPLPTWVPRTPDAPRRRGSDDDENWQRSENLWHSRFAAKVLHCIPVPALMENPQARPGFIDALEAFVSWTLDTLNPSWRVQQRRGRERSDVSLLEWQGELGRTLARCAPFLTTPELRDRLLRSITAQPDDVAMRVLAAFAERLVCAEILDAATMSDGVLEQLRMVLERTLEHRDLRRSRYNDGRISGFDLPELIKSLLFVSVAHAPRASRFANGQWDELDRVMPLADHMVRSAGWNPYVARQWVTLCERAGPAYPAEVFADQILAQLSGGHLPAIWKTTSVPASIAALVQAHADRLHPLSAPLARKLLTVLDALVDLGDRRSAALQQSESFRGVRLAPPRWA